jgi:hypothetical protein
VLHGADVEEEKEGAATVDFEALVMGPGGDRRSRN